MGKSEMTLPIREQNGVEFIVSEELCKREKSLKDERFPELLATIIYLNQFDRQTFSSVDEFKNTVINGFSSYLHDFDVPKGQDPKLSLGLYIVDMINSPIKVEGKLWSYSVESKTSYGSCVCIFGGLVDKHLSL